jgi:hypothetical protein
MKDFAIGRAPIEAQHTFMRIRDVGFAAGAHHVFDDVVRVARMARRIGFFDGGMKCVVLSQVTALPYSRKSSRVRLESGLPSARVVQMSRRTTSLR